MDVDVALALYVVTCAGWDRRVKGRARERAHVCRLQRAFPHGKGVRETNAEQFRKPSLSMSGEVVSIAGNLQVFLRVHRRRNEKEERSVGRRGKVDASPKRRRICGDAPSPAAATDTPPYTDNSAPVFACAAGGCLVAVV